MLKRMIAQPEVQIRSCLLLICATMLLSACAASSPPLAEPVRDDQAIASSSNRGKGRPTAAELATSVALSQVGIAYRYGGQRPATGFDCSGLVHYAYLEAGVALPRTTASLWDATERVPRSRLRRGDLVFFNIEGKMQHVGLYLGEERFVHAPSSGRKVSVDSLSSAFYSEALKSGGRLR